MKKLFIIIFDQLETDGRENIEFLWWLVCECHMAQLIDKQGTLTLFFCIVKPLHEQFFDWKYCIDICTEGEKKSVQNGLLTAFFTGKMKINHLGTWNIPFSWQTVDILGLFQIPGKNFLIKNMVRTCVFKTSTKICYTFGKNARNKCFRSK